MEDKKTITIRTPLSETEYDEVFLQGMINRMAVSEHKYGKVANNYPEKVSAIDSLKKRLELYFETGNTECLIDMANFAMIEFMKPSIEEAKFTPTDSDGSPGLVERKTMDDEKPNRDDGLIQTALTAINKILIIHDERLLPSEKEDLFLAKGHLLIMKERGLR